MQAQYSQRKNRIKLRVTTSTGLNLLCTANRSQKIKELLPHIIKLYEEVKEDQGLTEKLGQSVKPFIKYIKKEGFLIAASESVGDIFDDNDEVFCEMGSDSLSVGRKEQVKQQQQQEKQEKKESTSTPSNTKKEPTPSDPQQHPTIPKTKKIKKKTPKAQQPSSKTKPTTQPASNENAGNVSNQAIEVEIGEKKEEGKKESKKKRGNKGKGGSVVGGDRVNTDGNGKDNGHISSISHKAQQAEPQPQANNNKTKQPSIQPNPVSQSTTSNPKLSASKPTTSTPITTTPSQQQAPVQKPSSKPSSKKPQPQQQKPKPSASLLSTDELQRFREMMKKKPVVEGK